MAKKIDSTYIRTAKDILNFGQIKPVCIDVGSAGGFHPRLEAIQSNIELIGFDADPDECARLNAENKRGRRHINAAIGRENEQVILELHHKRKTSSCYPTDIDRVAHFHDFERYAPEGEISFKTTSLDQVCASEGIDCIDFIKVDVEGHELAVLEGCSELFLLAEVEVYFHPFRKGAATFDEIMNHMRNRGYLLMDLRRNFWSPDRTGELRNFGAKGFLMHGDALFCLDPFLGENHSAFTASGSITKYLALLCLYGYPTEALMCVDIFRKKGLMPDGDATIIENIIMKYKCRKFGFRLGRILLFLEKWIAMPVAVKSGLFLSKFYQADGDLGNSD